MHTLEEISTNKHLCQPVPAEEGKKINADYSITAQFPSRSDWGKEAGHASNV
jgi:hypothetical protein